jgi:hypothetical protein
MQQQQLQEGEVYNQMGELVYNNNGMLNEHEPTITIVDGVAIATIPEAYEYSRRIPEGGFTFNDIFAMSARLRVRGPWLAAQLSRPEFGGAAGAYVAELGTLNVDLNAAVNNLILNAGIIRGVVNDIFDQRERRQFVPTLNIILLPVNDADDDDCLICLGGNPQEIWATCAGCDFHRFHFECITHWRGSACMVCRRRLA